MHKPIPKNLPAIGTVRLAHKEDVTSAWDLCTEPMQKTFRLTGPASIAGLIDKAVLAITQLSEVGDIIGVLVGVDYPLIPSVHPTAWEEYIWTKYKLIDLNARNTLFLHLLCWKKEYGRDVVDAMLHSVFMHDPHLHYVGLIKTIVGCQQLMPGSSRPEASFRRVQAMDRGISSDLLPALYLAERVEVCPRLRVRRAVEEDNDDIIPIIERSSKRLRQLYGDYYVSELIARHPESDRVLVVCEHKELAVGVMCLNTQINFEALEECYDLSPYAGLRKVDAGQVCMLPKPMLTELKAVSSIFTDQCFDRGLSATFSEDMSLILADGGGDVEGTQADHLLGEVSHDAFVNLYHDMEEDEESYDIINIDSDLLMPSVAGEAFQKNFLDGVPTIETTGMVDETTQYVKKKSICPSPSAIQQKDPEHIVRYSGEPNAFLVELCAMQLGYDERYAFDMLEASFELFPERDYCIVCLPSSHPPFPLLEHFTLVTPNARRMRFINESLFVAHVNSVRGKLSVRPGELSDVDCLNDLLEHVKRRDVIVDLYATTLLSQSLDTYMLMSENQPVGVIIVGPTEEYATIRTQYDLEPESRKPGTDGTILVGVLSPALESHSRWYLREILRRSRYATLFWFCHTFARGEQDPKNNMMSLAESMIPVRPRCSLPNITQDKTLDHIYNDLQNPFALWAIEKPITSIPQICVNNSIVLVGASRTGLAFLESLISGPTAKYLTFSNLTLVSEYGLPTVSDCLKAADTCIPQEGRYTDRYLKSVPFAFYVDIMPATLVSIDRKKKCIYLRGGGLKYYDELLITCGQQFQHPDYLKELIDRAKEVNKGKPCKRMLMDDPTHQPDKVPAPLQLPDNVFLINSPIQANRCFRRVLAMMAKSKSLSEDNPVVVYGHCMEAQCCIAGLIELGISGHCICFVENFPSEDPGKLRVSWFNDTTVDERVHQSLDAVGVKQLKKCRLVKWKTKNGRVTSIRLMMPLHCVEQTCFALFYFGLKSINIEAFKAINECGLVYDGGVVVGPTFETNDPHIYAAGTCCKYSRRLYANNNQHDYYNSEDVGEALANMFLSKFDPFVACHPDHNPESLLPKYNPAEHGRRHPSIPDLEHRTSNLPVGRRWQPVMKFDSPIIQSGTFAGPLYYLKVRKPGPDVPLAVQMILPHQGHTLITVANNTYFRLQLNVLHVINSITCLSSEPFSIELFTQLYGKHEAFFNRLLLRYQFQQIDNFFDFFMQPWMSAIYQENFRDLLYNVNMHELESLSEELLAKFKEIKNIVPQEKPATRGIKPATAEKTETTNKTENAEKTQTEDKTDTADKSETADKTEADDKTKSDDKTETKTDIEKTETQDKTETDEKTADPSEDVKGKGSLGTCKDTPDCLDEKGRTRFRSLIEEYVRKVAEKLRAGREVDIPSECGQSAELRDRVSSFWETLAGEKSVFSHIATHISRNSVMNPHYAPPKSQYYCAE